MRRLKRFVGMLLIFMIVLSLWAPVAAQATYLGDPKDLGVLSKGQAITRIDPVRGSDNVKFHDYWTIIVDGRTVGEDLVITELTKTSGAYNYIPWSKLVEWVNTFNGSISYVEREASRAFRTFLSANGRTSTRVHIRPLARACGAYVEKWNSSQRKVWVITTPWPSGNIPDLRGIVAGQTKSFWVDAYATTLETQGLTYSFTINGNQVIQPTTVRSNYAGFYVTYKFASAGSYTMRLEVTDTVGRTTPIIKTISVDPAPQPPPPPALPPSPGQPVADFNLPPLGEVGENIPVVNKSRASDGLWLVHSVWKVTPRTYTGSLGMQGGTLVFNKPGIYTVKLQVWDNKNNTSTATKSISISDKAPPPEPPVPPEPKNIPPVARFDMVSQASLGVSVPVKNRSYDPDGEIVSVDWDVSPTANAKLGDTGGTIIFEEPRTYEVTLTVEDDRGDSKTAQRTIRITNKPPVARISMPTTVFQGDDVKIRSDSYDPDGEIAEYTWSVTPAGMVGTITGQEGTVYFDEPGTYTVKLTVKDRFGLTDTATKTIEVKPAVPTAFFRWAGTPKQNRKMVFDSSESYGSARYPVDFGRNQWEFIPPVGVPDSAIKIVSSPDLKTRQVLFKEPGDYRVRLAVMNIKGTVSEWYEQVVKVYPDQPPVADFYTIKTVTRDRNNANKAAIALMDRSNSPDGDTVSQRVWKYRYDSNNDGSFEDEAWVTLDSGNNPTPFLYTSQVGKYEFNLMVEESFGQETIPGFITAADLRTANTSAKPLAERTVEVINIAPVVNFDVLRKKQADIVFTIGEVDPAKIQDLRAKITQQIEVKLAAKNIDYGTIQSITASTFSSNDADATEIFNKWTRYGYNQNTWQFDSTNKIIKRENNDYWAGFYDPNFNSSEYTLDVDLTTFSYDDDDIGITFGMDGGPNGSFAYILSGNNSRSFSYSNQTTNRHGHATGLYQYNGSTIKGLVDNHWREFTPNNWHHLKLQVSGNNAKIWLDGDLVVNYTASRELKGSYGFFTNSQPQGAFKNLTVSSKTIKTLDDILKEPSWRQNAQKFLVNISDVQYPEFNDPQKAAVIYSRLLSNGIYFNVLGTGTNRSQAQSIIVQNNGKGRFIDNNNMDVALSRLADYIIAEVMKQPRLIEQYMLLGEEVEYKTYYEDQENDPAIQRRWFYNHHPYWFENSLGEASYDGHFLPAPITRFDKVGKFDVEFQVRDNPKNDDRFDNYRMWSAMPQDNLILYVHRRPLALFTASLTPQGSMTIETYKQSNIDFVGEGGSYAQWEPQFDAPAGTTIERIEFKTAVASDDYYRDGEVRGYKNSSWHVIKSWGRQPRDTAVSDVLDVSGQGFTKIKFYFRMYDSAHSARGNGTGSYYKIDVKRGSISGYKVTLQNNSYDLDHQTEPQKGIVQEVWRWKRATEPTWHQGQPTQLASGETYLVSLRVKDVEGVWSDDNVKVLRTGTENMPPVAQFSVSPNPLPLRQRMKYNDLSYDPNGDPITQRRWRLTKLPGGSWVDYGGTPPNNFDFLGEGEYRIELTVRDSAGVWSEPFYQTVTVIPDNKKPIARFTVNPNPLPLDVTVTYKDTSWDPDGDPIVAREWQWQKNSGTWHNGQPQDFKALGIGSYNIRLRVKDQPALAQMTPLWSDWHMQTLSVVAGNQKPVAQFTVAPNPALTDEPVTYTDTSYDPDGAGISEQVWQVTTPDGRVLGEYHNKLPPRLFANTGWGDGGAGTYRIGLRVRDKSPNGVSPSLWSDWTWKTLTIVMPLTGSGEIAPNPALSGFRIRVTIWTSGYAEEVRVKFPNDRFFHGDEISLTPESPVSSKHNIWLNSYLTDAKTPDGPYAVTATIKRTSVASQTVTVPLTLIIHGDIYDQIKVRMRDSR